MYTSWTPKLRRYVINQWKLGITPVSQIARGRSVPRRTIYYLIERYKRYGFPGLEPKPKGRKKESLNPKFVHLIYELFELFGEFMLLVILIVLLVVLFIVLLELLLLFASLVFSIAFSSFTGFLK